MVFIMPVLTSQAIYDCMIECDSIGDYVDLVESHTHVGAIPLKQHDEMCNNDGCYVKIVVRMLKEGWKWYRIGLHFDSFCRATPEEVESGLISWLKGEGIVADTPYVYVCEKKLIEQVKGRE